MAIDLIVANRLRKDIDANETTLPNEEIEDIYAEAGESYTDAATIKYETRVIAISRILASASKLASYKNNESSVDLSDVAKALERLLKIWEDRRNKAIADADEAAGKYKPLFRVY